MRKFNTVENFYDEFSRFYNDTIPLQEKVNADRRISKFDELFDRCYGADKQQSRILELGCGTGEYAVDLAKAGYDVTGIDISKNMLAICEKAAKAHDVPVKLICADWNSSLASFNGDFNVILCMGNSLHHNPMTYIQELFNLCFKALKPNGLLIFNCRNYDEDLGLTPPEDDSYRLVELREDVDIPGLGNRNVIKYIFRNISVQDDVARIAFYTYDNYREDRRTFNFHMLETGVDSAEKRKLTTMSCDVFYVYRNDVIKMLQLAGFAEIGDRGLGVSHKWWYLSGVKPQ